MDVLDYEDDREVIAQIAGVTPGQVSAIAAHRTMGRRRDDSATNAPPGGGRDPDSIGHRDQ
jgi:hypothetical protein